MPFSPLFHRCHAHHARADERRRGVPSIYTIHPSTAQTPVNSMPPPRIVSGQPQAVIAASISSFEKMQQLRIFQSVRQRLPSLIKRRPNNGEHQLLILRLHRHHLMTRQPDHRTSNLRPRHKNSSAAHSPQYTAPHNTAPPATAPRNPSIPAPSASGPQPPSEP